MRRRYWPRWLIWTLVMLGVAAVTAAMIPGVELLLGESLSTRVPGAHITELAVVELSFGIMWGVMWVLGLPGFIFVDIRHPRGGRR